MGIPRASVNTTNFTNTPEMRRSRRTQTTNGNGGNSWGAHRDIEGKCVGRSKEHDYVSKHDKYTGEPLYYECTRCFQYKPLPKDEDTGGVHEPEDEDAGNDLEPTAGQHKGQQT